MGNACGKPSSLAQVEAEDAVVQQSPPSAAKQEAAQESSSKAGGDVQAAPLSPRPPSGKSKAAPRPGQKKCCFAEAPATEWQIPAAEAGPAASTAQPQQP